MNWKGKRVKVVSGPFKGKDGLVIDVYQQGNVKQLTIQYALWGNFITVYENMVQICRRS